MKHQLKFGTYCVPESKEQCLEILRIAKNQSIIGELYMADVLNGVMPWPTSGTPGSIDKAVKYSNLVSAFVWEDETEIPVEEFIARLKGEWVEPGLSFSISIELNGKTYKWGFKK